MEVKLEKKKERSRLHTFCVSHCALHEFPLKVIEFSSDCSCRLKRRQQVSASPLRMKLEQGLRVCGQCAALFVDDDKMRFG